MDKLTSLSRFGAIQGRAITKAAVTYTLGAALFCAENARAEKPIPRNDRRKRYENADNGRATERHWLLGVALAKRCADAVAEILASANNDADAAGMVERLAGMIAADATAEGVDIRDSNGRIVWSKLDTWVSSGEAKAAPTLSAKLANMVKGVAKLTEDVGAGEARAIADSMEKELLSAVRDAVKALRGRADAYDILTENHAADPADADAAARAAVKAGAEGEAEDKAAA